MIRLLNTTDNKTHFINEKLILTINTEDERGIRKYIILFPNYVVFIILKSEEVGDFEAFLDGQTKVNYLPINIIEFKIKRILNKK